MMLMATPLTTWLPRWVMQAKPCSSAITSAAMMAAATPAQAEPVTAEVAAAKNAAISILPSSPTSMMPLFSENSPPMAHSTSGVATRRVAASIRKTREKRSSITPAREEQAARAATAATAAACSPARRRTG